MLERVALHQTRFRVPGLEADARGVAVGARGLILFGSLDRLITFLSAYSSEHSFDALAASLRIDVVKSGLGLRETVLSFEAGSSDRMDGIADVARLTGGLVFTGSDRHFVEYRNRAAPFGWDASELLAGRSELCLYHSTFSQAYDVERPIDVRGFVLRLPPRPARRERLARGARFLLAELGLGPVLVKYFARASVDAKAAIVDLPAVAGRPERDTAWLFQVAELLARFAGLRVTPGVRSFVPVNEGVAVEEGFRHAFNLGAFPFFDASGLVLFRGAEPALDFERRPALVPVQALVSGALGAPAVHATARTEAPAALRISLRIARSVDGPRVTRALFIPKGELPLLRRLAYVLDAPALRGARVAFTNGGAFLVSEDPPTAVPLGSFFGVVAPRVYAPLGFAVVPRVSERTLAEAIGAPAGSVTFFLADGRVGVIDDAAFAPLDRALTEGGTWAPLPAESLDVELPELSTVHLEPLGFRPLSRAKPASL